VLAAVVIPAAVSAQLLGNPLRTRVGVGTRQLALGNNVVAAADDGSALFWNPAGMAFADKRQLQLSVGGFRPSTRTTFRVGEEVSRLDARTQRIRLGNASFVRPYSTRRGGLSLGFAYQNPYLFDAVIDYGGSYVLDTARVELRNEYLAMGQLDFWTAGIGFQVAPNVSLGGALSLITGHGTDELRFRKRTSGAIADPLGDYYHDTVERRYLGVDTRLGFLYRTLNGFSLGLRVELPGAVAFEETGTEVLPAAPEESYEYRMTGALKSYYAGAFGAAWELPFLSVAAEVNARAPRPHRRLDEPVEQWRSGAGVGVEAPILDGMLVLRGGYTWREHDPNPYTVTYDYPAVEGAGTVPESSTGEHMFSAGCGLNFGDRVLLDVGFAQRLYELDTHRVLHEDHASQRALASITVKY
jgi:hypothetical protein